MGTLTPVDVSERLKGLPQWDLEGSWIRRQFTFAGFPEAITFVVRLSYEAEAADHHPDLLISYKRVTVGYTTHSEGGLTEKDFKGATRATELAQAIGGR